MDIKRNDFILVRRVEKKFTDIDIDEFTDCVRGHRNGGYQLHGDVILVMTETECVIAQALKAQSPTSVGEMLLP